MPLHVTVTLRPFGTLAGLALRLAGTVVLVVVVAVLFAGLGSAALATVAVLVMVVPCGVPALTRTTSVKRDDVPQPRAGFVHVTVPVPPTGGRLGQSHPPGVAGGVIDLKV